MSQSKWSRRDQWFRRGAASLLVCASVVTLAPVGGSIAPVVSAQATSDPGGEFHALAPTRILDTRPGEGPAVLDGLKRINPNAATDASAEFSFKPLGLGGLPDKASDVLAIVANVTVVDATDGGFVSLFPRGVNFGGPDGKSPTSSLVNFDGGNPVPNMAIVGLDSEGFLTVTAGGGTGRYHLIIDLLGFVSTSQYSTGGARLEVVTPGRVLDTRQSSPIGARQTRVLPMRGADTIKDTPSDKIVTDIVPKRATVTAALVNLTLINNKSGSSTFLTATPEKIPTTGTIPSSSNVIGGAIKATVTVVPISADGSIRLYNHAGNLDVAVDVLGYFETGVNAAGNRGRVVPLDSPFRALDTRLPAYGDFPLQHGSKEEWSFDSFVKSVVLNPGAATETTGPPQQGFLGSLVAIDLQPLAQQAPANQSSYLRLTPAGGTTPVTSNVNFYVNKNVANMSLVKYGPKGQDPHVIEAYNHYGQVDYLLDVYAIVLDD